MSNQRYVGGDVPERFLEVDAARLLLILAKFSNPIDGELLGEDFLPRHPVARHFTPEYFLQKLDFLVRYPGYLAYDLIELHRRGEGVEREPEDTMASVRQILRERQPELRTLPFRKFWRGAYERLDHVETWWFSRRLVYTTFQSRGNARPQKHYFVTVLAMSEAERLVNSVEHAQWYADRIDLIHHHCGDLTAAQVKDLQYSHDHYRRAQLNEVIPNLSPREIAENFATVFGEPIGVELE